MLIAEELFDDISVEQINGWYDRFRFYRHAPSREEIVEWIEQFAKEDRHLAARMLDEVILISDAQIHQGYRSALHALEGWSEKPEDRTGSWAFVGLGGQAESGPAMLHMFREANGLTSDRYQDLFVTPAELPRMRLTAHDTVVFVDDFSGTGDQFTTRWNTYQELISGEAKLHLFLAASTRSAFDRLKGLPDLLVRSEIVLEADKNIFSKENASYSDAEREVILKYCKKALKQHPKGWGKCGLLLVISRKTPNNSIPILHADSKRWRSIFPRQLVRIGVPPAAAGA